MACGQRISNRYGTTAPDTVRGVERCRALAGELVALINSCDPEQLRRRARKDLVDNDRIKSQPRQGRDPRTPQIMNTPRDQRR